MRIYLSCVVSDRTVADIVSQLLLRVYPAADVHIEDHAPASVGSPKLGEKLRSAHVIVLLLTPRSFNDPWLIFEAGVGLKRGVTVPLIAGDLKPEQLPAPLQLLPACWMTRKGLTRLLEDTATACGMTPPAKLVGVQEALYRLQAQLSPTPVPRTDPSGPSLPSAVRQRVDKLISRTHHALVRLIVNSMAPNSSLAEDDLNNMRLEQLRDIADYAGISYPTFLLFTLSSLQTSLLEKDDASWSLFSEEAQLARLEGSLVKLEQTAFLEEP